MPPRMGRELCTLGQSVAAKSQIPEATMCARVDTHGMCPDRGAASTELTCSIDRYIIIP